MGHFSTLRNLTSVLTMDGICCQVFFKVNIPKHNRSFFRPYPAWSLMIICFFLKVLTMDYYDTTFFYLSSSFLAALSKNVQINSNFSVVIYKVLQVYCPPIFPTSPPLNFTQLTSTKKVSLISSPGSFYTIILPNNDIFSFWSTLRILSAYDIFKSTYGKTSTML